MIPLTLVGLTVTEASALATGWTHAAALISGCICSRLHCENVLLPFKRPAIRNVGGVLAHAWSWFGSVSASCGAPKTCPISCAATRDADAPLISFPPSLTETPKRGLHKAARNAIPTVEPSKSRPVIRWAIAVLRIDAVAFL